MTQNQAIPPEENEQPQVESEPLVWPETIYPYYSGIIGGLIGGAAMAVVGMIAGIVIGRGPWYPVNLIAAAAIANFQAMSPEQLQAFSLAGLFVGAVLHFTISIVIGLSFTVLLPAFPGHPLIWSVIAGGLLWVFANIIFLPLLNPKMIELVDVPSFIIAHFAYTIPLGLIVSRYEKVPINLAWPNKTYPYHAGVIGGAIGGIGMAIVGIIAGILLGHGPWYPINLVAAAAIRSFQTMTPEQLSAFNFASFFVATILHFTISIIIGLIFARLLPAFPGHPLVWSLIGGSVLWVFVDIIFLLLVNPTMGRLVNVSSFIIAHFVYTILLGLWVNRYEKVPIR